MAPSKAKVVEPQGPDEEDVKDKDTPAVDEFDDADALEALVAAEEETST